jgi:hypothetical protein
LALAQSAGQQSGPGELTGDARCPGESRGVVEDQAADRRQHRIAGHRRGVDAGQVCQDHRDGAGQSSGEQGAAVGLAPAGGEVVAVVAGQDQQPPAGVDGDRSGQLERGEAVVAGSRQRADDPVHRDLARPCVPLGVYPPGHGADATRLLTAMG